MRLFNRNKNNARDNQNPKALFNQAIAHYEAGELSEAVSCFERAAQLGDVLAMNNLSSFYHAGLGVDASTERAFYWRKRAAESGHEDSYYNLAYRYLYGEGTQKNLAQAENWAKLAAKVPNNFQEDAQTMLQEIQQQLRQPPQPAAPNPQALMDEGMRYVNAQQWSQAFSCFERGAQLGDAGAMNNLSVMYANGDGVPVDLEKAFYWMKKAAEGGCDSSYYTLAVKYYNGDGTQKDLDQAEHWAEKATQITNNYQANAQGLLQEIRRQKQQQRTHSAPYSGDLVNQGVEYYETQQWSQAFSCFERAANMGNVYAMGNLSLMYHNGQGVPANAERAFYWRKNAAERGDENSYYKLAYYYFFGQGTQKDLKQAEFWAEKAAKVANSDQSEAQRMLQHLRQQAQQQQQQRTQPQQQTQTALDPQALMDEGMRYVNAQQWSQAFSCFERAAQLGAAGAMNNLSVMYANGNGVPVDRDKAFYWMKKAAEGGSDSSYYTLAVKYYTADGTQRDLAQAKLWAEKAVQANSNQAEAKKLLQEIQQEKQTPQQTAPSTPSPKPRTAAPAVEDQSKRTYIHLLPGVDRTAVLQAFEKGRVLYNEDKYAEALPYLEQAGKAGHCEALFCLGAYYINGYLVEKSFTLGLEFMLEAYYRGSEPAYRYLTQNGHAGWIFAIMAGVGFRRGEEKAGEAYDKMHRFSDERKEMVNAAKAVTHPGIIVDGYILDEHYRFYYAADLGSLDGLCGEAEEDLLKRCTIRNDRRTPLPYESAALDKFKLAAIAGHPYAMMRVGEMYRSRNRAVANACFKIAAEWGNAKAINYIR